MTIEEIKTDDGLTLAVNGKIDTRTSDEFANVIIHSFQKTNALTVDMSEVTYLSSAGLRAFMLGQKTASSKGASFKLINVQNEVKEIFHLTGFEKILNIS